MRNLLSTCALALAIACATQLVHAAETAAAPHQPAASATPAESAAPAAEATPSERTDAEATAAAQPKEDANSPEFQRVARSYRQVEKDGQTLYCRNEKRLGTRLGSPVCLTEAQLWERIHKAEDVRDEMRRSSSGPCGSAAASCE